jgi:hypothetical protein
MAYGSTFCTKCGKHIYLYSISFIGLRWQHGDDTPVCKGGVPVVE